MRNKKIIKVLQKKIVEYDKLLDIEHAKKIKCENELDNMTDKMELAMDIGINKWHIITEYQRSAEQTCDIIRNKLNSLEDTVDILKGGRYEQKVDERIKDKKRKGFIWF